MLEFKWIPEICVEFEWCFKMQMGILREKSALGSELAAKCSSFEKNQINTLLW